MSELGAGGALSRDIGTADERELAARIAYGWQRRLPGHVLREDLQQAALIGLWDGIRKDRGSEAGRDPGRRKGYLIRRVQGQILDELRAQDWMPRGARRRGDAPVVLRGDDAGEFFGEKGSWESRAADGSLSAEDRLCTGQLAKRARSVLNERELFIVSRVYDRGIKFADVAAELGISEPRISQLHARAILKMRAALETDESTTTAPRVLVAVPEELIIVTPEAVPSVLPETGFNIHEAISSYRAWMMDQALLRASNDIKAAASLLGMTPEGLKLNLKSRGTKVPKGRPGRRKRSESPAPVAPKVAAAKPAPPKPPPPPSPEEKTAARINRTEVAGLRQGGLTESQIAGILSKRLGVNRFLVEKALKLQAVAA